MQRPTQFTVRGATLVTALTALAVAPTAAQSQGQQAAPVAPTATAPTKAKAKTKASFTVKSARKNVVAGKRVLVAGHLRGAGRGKNVALQMRRGTSAWKTVARDVTGAKGAYRMRTTPEAIGTYTARVTYAGDEGSRSARKSLGTIAVYRKVLVSWYGGGAGACGNSGRYSLGVANKTLPCGSKVRLRYKNRTVTAHVVDRGPYVGGREFDLTPATKAALGAGDLTTVMSTR